MKLVSIVFDKTTSEYKLYYKDEKTGKPYHIAANHLLRFCVFRQRKRKLEKKP